LEDKLIKKTKNKRNNYEVKDTPTINRIYFDENHVLGNEVCEILGNHMANISNLKSENILKVGNCPIMLKYDVTLPPKMKSIVLSGQTTSLKDKMVLSYFKSEYNLTDSEIMKYIAEDIEEIAGKKFIVYKKEFLDKIKNISCYDNILYVLSKKEYEELDCKDVLKYTQQVSKNKYIVIY
jgi:hypothetical protein